jgi:hypothetical protein
MNYVSSILKRMKTKRSPLDCSDFVKKRPAPSIEAIWDRVDARYMGNTAEPKVLEMHKRRMFFDLKYRCGGEGRCLEGDYRCRFPSCFCMRPCVKGGEIFIERYGLEDKIAVKNADIVSLLNKEKLDEAIDKLHERIDAAVAQQVPTKMTDTSLDNWMNMVMMHATLLMNAGRDEEAVESLLTVAKTLPKKEQVECFCMAANWAVLHDMEVRFFRMHMKEFPDLEGAAEKAARPEVLKRVADAVADDDEIEDHVVHAVLGKEVTTIVARAQNAQDYNDPCEDPIATSVVHDSVVYYKEVIGGRFWEKFFHLAMAPPLDPSTDPAEAPVDETPRHVLDAVGRSMLLHHVAKLYGSDELPNAEGKGFVNVDPKTLDALPKMQRVTLKRMQELLSVVKQHTATTPKKRTL